jgi:3',5'-cyclic AMP phosphodiesterase CpdA
VRVVQLSDTHLAASVGVPQPLRSLINWIEADPPDLVVHTGDIVLDDPDVAADHAFARDVIGALPCPVYVIPGNHDVGFFDADRFPKRVSAFRDTWGNDRFVLDGAGWRLVGIDVYAIGDEEADAWTDRAVDTGDPLAVFVHHPLAGEPNDGWALPEPVRARCADLISKPDVRLVASGHRHCAVVRPHPDGATHVWAPSTTLTGPARYHGGDPSPGAVEYRFASDGSCTHRFVSVTAAVS